MIEEVITEMRTARPDRTIHSDVAASRPVFCDRARIGQLLSNLLANALTHGDPAGPVWVRAQCADGTFELSVTNHGPRIPHDTMARLFQPFARTSHGPDRGGLGLGLYIASEIARCHDGAVGGQILNRGDAFHLPHAGDLVCQLPGFHLLRVGAFDLNEELRPSSFRNRRALSGRDELHRGRWQRCAVHEAANALLVDCLLILVHDPKRSSAVCITLASHGRFEPFFSPASSS